jgi:hypothetical protein
VTTRVLLVSLCREEYNKVTRLESTKKIWDTLKLVHEGDKITKITKMELREGELGRFAKNKREGSQEKYNWIKSLANKSAMMGARSGWIT